MRGANLCDGTHSSPSTKYFVILASLILTVFLSFFFFFFRVFVLRRGGATRPPQGSLRQLLSNDNDEIDELEERLK